MAEGGGVGFVEGKGFAEGVNKGDAEAEASERNVLSGKDFCFARAFSVKTELCERFREWVLGNRIYAEKSSGV